MENRIKKEYDRKSGRTQKMVNFRADLDVVDLLNQVANKGRCINDAVRAYFASRNIDESRTDEDPASGQREDVQA